MAVAVGVGVGIAVGNGVVRADTTGRGLAVGGRMEGSGSAQAAVSRTDATAEVIMEKYSPARLITVTS